MSPVKELGWWIWGVFTGLALIALVFSKETIAAHITEIYLASIILFLGNAFRLRRRIRETCATTSGVEMALILHPGALVFAIALACLAWKQAS